MELQIDSSGGNKRKYALTEIKADIANKRLYVRRSPPDLCIWGEAPAQPNPPSREGTTTLILDTSPKPNPKGDHNMASRTTKTNKTTTAPPTPTKT
jgi:hypothetical protein